MTRSVVYQLLNLETAVRSVPLSGSLDKVREQLEMLVPISQRDRFSVLVLLDANRSEDFEFSQCPVLSVSQFLKVELV